MSLTPLDTGADRGRLRVAVALLAAGTLLLVALVAGGIATAVGGDAAAVPPTKASDTLGLDLPLLSGGRITAANLSGRVAVVNVWASWCPPCREEAPSLRRVATEADPVRVAFLGVASRDAAAPARAYVADYGIPYPNALDDGSVTQRYEVSLLPTTLIFDRHGALVVRIAGALSETRLRTLIDDALAAP